MDGCSGGGVQTTDGTRSISWESTQDPEHVRLVCRVKGVEVCSSTVPASTVKKLDKLIGRIAGRNRRSQFRAVVDLIATMNGRPEVTKKNWLPPAQPPAKPRTPRRASPAVKTANKKAS